MRTALMVALSVLISCGAVATLEPSGPTPTEPVTDSELAQPGRQPTPLDRLGEAPSNPFAADPMWGLFHRNNYAQAATLERGPEPGETFTTQYVSIPGNGGAPTQMHISAPYPDGSRTAWSTNLTHIVKARVRGDAFELAGAYQITPRVQDFNIHWNMTLGKGNKAFVPSPKERSILRFGDADPQDPMSAIVLEGKFTLPSEVKGAAVVLNLSYDGWLIFVTDEAWVGAVKTDFSQSRFFDLGKATNDITTHNSFPIDENGNLFIASLYAMTKVRWTGREFKLVWRTPYNFRGIGCPPPAANPTVEVIKVVTGQGCTGTGTTPTLVGRGSMDKLVVVVDSHNKNNLVAFWRDDIPAGWKGMTDQDRRVAGVLQLPYSTWEGQGFSAENSPPVLGYDIAVAQYAGFTPRCLGPRGVQMARWNPLRKRLELLWANAEVPFNNVMTLSAGSGLVYGSGRDRNCQYVYRGLDRFSGKVAFEIPLGNTNQFSDSGNTNALLEDRSIVFGVPEGIARIRPVAQ
jgi:hypothetical protein